jgi:hypothetical protein
MEQMRRALPVRLAEGKARVLKENRGNGGEGLWKVELVESASLPQPGPGLYYPTDKRGFQALKRKVEQEWVASCLHIAYNL